MTPPTQKVKKRLTGSRVAALVILFLVIVSLLGYYFLSPSSKPGVAHKQTETAHLKPALPVPNEPMTVKPEVPTEAPPLEAKPRQPLTPVISRPTKPGIAGNKSVRLAIIIDDMGSNLAEAQALAAIKVPLTFSIIPGLRYDKAVAAFAAANNTETMIHIPMQSKGWPGRRLETNGLLVAMAAEELQERAAAFTESFPGAVGANNHTGSEFTEHEDKMAAVLKVLQQKNMFFIDSVTSPASVGLRVAQQLGIRTARRNVFLDNEQERGYITGQLNQAVRMAQKNGSAIAICHPHPVTIATLAALLPELAGQGVNLVPASQLVK